MLRLSILWDSRISFNRNHAGPRYGRRHPSTVSGSGGGYPTPTQYALGRTGTDCDKRTAYLLNLSVRRILLSGKEYEDITRDEFAQILAWAAGEYRDESLLQGFLYRDAA